MTVTFFFSCIFAIGQEKPSSIAGSLNVINSVIDNDKNYNQLSSSVSVSYSAIRSDILPSGSGNIKISNSYHYHDSLAITADRRSYFLSPTHPVRNHGNHSISAYLPEKDINGNDRIYDTQVDMGAVEYSMIFDKGTGSWHNTNNWNIGRTPHRYDIVSVRNLATVMTDDGVCKSIIQISENGKLTVNAGKQLDVKTTINNTNSEKIVIKADETLPNGTLIFHNSFNSPVSATVEMYSKAYINEELDDNDTDKFNWQYIGIPFRSMSTVPTEGSWYVRKFTESLNLYDKWESLSATDNLNSFRGYEIAQDIEKIYTFKGVLENRDTTINLTRTNNVPYAGQHILANPYTSSIKIKDLVFGGNLQATVFVYNSGSYADWNADKNNGRVGTDRGQYLAVPQNAADIILPEIPSMQGFLVLVTDGSGSLTIPYVASTKNVSSQRVKRNTSNPYIEIELLSENSFDKLWLIHEESADRNFNNGWDGYKIKSSKSTASIFTREESGDYQVNALNNINNSNIIFTSGRDKEYTLRVINHEINEIYNSIYIVDLIENKVTELKSDTTEYKFIAGEIKEPQHRFKIISSIDEEINNTDKNLNITQSGNLIIIENSTNELGNFFVYDSSGNLHRRETLPNGLTYFELKRNNEVQIIGVQAGSSKKFKKVIIL